MTRGRFAPGPKLEDVMKTMSSTKTLRAGHQNINPDSPTGRVRRRAVRRSLVIILGLAGIAATARWGYEYWQVGRYEISTDDAYVKADYTTIAPKVGGYITEVLVVDN